MREKKIAVLISGNGSNLRALVSAGIKVDCVISNKSDALGLEYAKNKAIEAIFLSPKGKSRLEYTKELIALLNKKSIDFVCLAGFMFILDKIIFNTFKDNILNIHPSLLPKYGGVGMYGMHVHEAVFFSGDKVSGATVHIVTEKCDTGPIIMQEEVDISDCDTAKKIASKVLKVEHIIYAAAVKKFIAN
ncbi:MAG: phosphoribosylglycinamide formyltransferase [bacterium]|nr:phosphoribosylglycinamide formyltransferase [bacterium]